MKNFRILIAACLLAMATAVNAQFANTSSSSKIGGGAVDTEGWQSVKLSYNKWTIDAEGAEFDAIPAFELGYVKAFSVSQTYPLFVEAGASLMYATGDLFEMSEENESDYYYYSTSASTSLKMFSLAIPVNIGYKIALNDKMTLFPYAGVTLKAHLSGKMKTEMETYSEYEDYYGDIESESDSESESYNVFDDDDMGDAWKRFQIGWQIGATLNINQYNVGLSYGADLMELAKKTDTKTFKISVGVNF